MPKGIMRDLRIRARSVVLYFHMELYPFWKQKYTASRVAANSREWNHWSCWQIFIYKWEPLTSASKIVMASFLCYDNSDVIVTLIITNFHLYLIHVWCRFQFPKICAWRRSLCSNLGGIDSEKLYRATLKVKWTKKLTYFLLSLYLHQTLKRTILSEIWVKIFLPQPL